MNITYTRVGDYLLPNIKLRDPPDAPPLGNYGLSERLYPLCREIDDAARNRRKLGMNESEIMCELVCE